MTPEVIEIPDDEPGMDESIQFLDHAPAPPRPVKEVQSAIAEDDALSAFSELPSPTRANIRLPRVLLPADSAGTDAVRACAVLLVSAQFDGRLARTTSEPLAGRA